MTGVQTCALPILREKIAIAPIVAIMLFLGFYPKPVLDIVNSSSATVMQHAGVTDPAAKAGK